LLGSASLSGYAITFKPALLLSVGVGHDRGTLLVLTGVFVLATTLVGSAFLAPQPTATDAEQSSGTLVGMQGLSSPGIVSLRNGSETVWRRAEADSYFEVERIDNSRYAVAFIDDGYTDCGAYDQPCARTGFRVIEADPDPHVVEEWTFPVRTMKNSEVHAVDPLPGGGFAIADMEYERIAIVQNGSITWQWNASSFYEAPPDPTFVDWLHINDVQAIGQDRFLVSVRNANQLLVIERGSGVAEVINSDRPNSNDRSCRRGEELIDYDNDGDVRCGNPGLFNHQHNPHWLGNGSVLVADSENDRIVELRRTANQGWQPIWTLERAGGIDLYWPRDVDRLPNGNTVIADSLNKRILEVNENDSQIWSTTVDAAPYELDRLPYGERRGVPLRGVNQSVGEQNHTAAADDLPILTDIVTVLHAGVPALPYWFREFQFLSTTFSLLFVLGGALVWYGDNT
jgi:hypothetical protein